MKLLNRGTFIIIGYSIIAALILWLTPVERTLGHFIKYVFFHLSLSFASLYGFFLSAFLGLIFLIFVWLKKENSAFGIWSKELGRISIVVWALSVIVSIFAMKLAWGEIAFTEPMTIFVIVVLALGIGKELIVSDKNYTTIAIANILFSIAIAFTRPNISKVMHPDDPIGTSDISAYKIMSTSLTIVTFIAIVLFTHWYINHKRQANIR